jgi:hydroxysqualene synthase
MNTNSEHYENFPVASILCPAPQRPAVTALYWFARTADDLADEGHVSSERRLADLAAFRSDFSACVQGHAVPPRWERLLLNVRSAMVQHSSSKKPFPIFYLLNLLDAFEKDVRDTAAGYRYPTRIELLAYCQLSANPVGRLMLHLFGVDDALSTAQSDAICTALQLINFWQDVSIDQPRGRFYVIDEPMADLCAWARELMLLGSPLCQRVAAQGHLRFGFELRLVVQGGLRILDKIEAQGFDTTTHRPTVTKLDMPLILWRALCSVPSRTAQTVAGG